MDHVQEFIKGFTCEAPVQLPDELRQRLHFLSCLSEKESRSVFLVRDQLTGETCILKITAPGSPDSARSEYRILANLDHPGIPRGLFFTEDETGREYLLRSYMEGDPLDRLLDRDGAFDETQVYDIVLKICSVLRYLHRQQPPIIYRDINPCNITLTANGKVSLIDFGISIKIPAGDRHSPVRTVLVGTIPFISPEQMGFDKTDHRSDIFALGKLMLYLYTGQADIRSDDLKKQNIRIGRLIEKCTRQSKERRFSSIRQLERAVLRTRKKPVGQAYLKGAAMAAGAGAVAFFLFGNYLRTDYRRPLYPPEVSINVGAVDDNLPLRSPELIAAVRQALIISDDTPLTAEMLGQVTAITIQAGSCDGDTGGMVRQRPALPRECLEELTYFSHLSELSVRGFRILDLTPIEALPLRTLQMTDCGISNISALDRLTGLEVLDLSNNPIEEIQVLAGFKHLKSLDLSYTYVRDVSALEKLSGLSDLNLGATRAADLLPLGSLTGLETLKISHVQIKDFAFLANLTHLTGLELKSTGFQDLTLITSPRLETLDISMNYNYLTDITPLVRFPKLRELDISMNEIEDYSPVYQLSGLQTLGIHEDQAEHLLLSERNPMQLPGLNKIILTAGEPGDTWQKLSEEGRVNVILRSYYEAY